MSRHCFTKPPSVAFFGLRAVRSHDLNRIGPYRAGRSSDWIKVKNQKHPAMSRVADSFA